MAEIRRTAEILDAWPQLRALAVAMRGDWDPEDTEQAIRAWEVANLPFGDAEREVHRVIWDPEGSPAEIRGTARARASSVVPPGRGVTREEREELVANLLTRCEAATEALHRQPKAAEPP